MYPEKCINCAGNSAILLQLQNDPPSKPPDGHFNTNLLNHMGVAKGSSTLHSIVELTLANVAHLCRRLAKKNGVPSPRVVCDCSNLVYIFKDSYTPVVIFLANHFWKFTAAGVVFVLVCDGNIFPTAKPATNVRIANQEKRHISALQMHSRIREIKEALVNNMALNDLLHAELEMELRKAERRVKINKTMSKVVVPPNFHVTLADELSTCNAHTINEESAVGFVKKVVVAEFLADNYMASQMLNGDAVMAMIKDTDVPILAGDSCIAIN